jgi:putative salt-induced outer membrane protein
MKNQIAAVFIGALIANFSYAKGNIELGYSKTGGSSETEKLITVVKLETELNKRWRNMATVSARKTSSKDDRIEEKYNIADKVDFLINKRSYAFGRVNHEIDNFSTFDFQTDISGGYGHQLIKSNTVDLKVEFGPGILITKLKDAPKTKEDNVGLYIGTHYQWKINDNVTYEQDISAHVSDTNKIVGAFAVKSSLSKALSAKLYSNINWNDSVAEGGNKTNTENGISLNYGF